MNCLGHIIFYLITASVCTIYVATYLIASSHILPLAILLGIPYALLPDVDIRSSHIRQFVDKYLLYLIVFSVISYIFIRNDLLLYCAVIVSLFLIVLQHAKHRHLFHSLPFALLFTVPLYLIHPYFFIYAFMGYISHLIGDFWRGSGRR